MSKTAVSILQELMVQRRTLPNYVIESCNDKLGASFKCTITFNQLCVHGYGPNKKEAKQNAAIKALQMLGIIIQNDNVAPPSKNTQLRTNSVSQTCFSNYIGKLNEYASTHGKTYPTYVDKLFVDNTITITGEFVTYCDFLNLRTEGYGMKKKDSKQDAARKMLEKLRTEDISITVTERISKLHIDNVKRIDNLNEIVEKYDNLVFGTKKEINIEVKSLPNLKIEVNTFEELRRELEKYDVKYTIDTFQRDPCIMMMKINGSNVTIMGKGETKTKALTDLYETALGMFQQGFTW